MSIAPYQDHYHAEELFAPPNVLPIRPEGIPEELKRRPRWVAWKLVKRRNGKWTKEPYDARTGRKASSTDLMTWGSFEEALAALQECGYDGAGFVFCSGDPFCAFDFDACRDPKTGRIDPDVVEMIEQLGGYAEISPSGRGVHVIVRGKIPRAIKRGWVEAYSVERFFTVTGHVLGKGW